MMKGSSSDNEPVDRITYQEIDRSRTRKRRYQPTDPRSQSPDGGVRAAKQALFVADEQMPRLRPDQIAQASDNIVRGEDSYASLVYLSRARTDDIGAIFQATQSPEIRVRWERLWVLSPFFAKLARLPDGRDNIVGSMQDDLASVHLLSKFAEQKNQSVLRLFKRLHDPLLKLLVSRLAEYREDPRRCELLAGIVATVEADADALRKAVEAAVGPRDVEAMLPLLFIRYKDPRLNKLSSGVLREKLETWSGGS